MEKSDPEPLNFTGSLKSSLGRIWWLPKPLLKLGTTLNTKDITKSSQYIFSLLEAAPGVFTVCYALERPHPFIFTAECFGMGFSIFSQLLIILGSKQTISLIHFHKFTQLHTHTNRHTHHFHTANGQLQSDYSKI